MTTIREVCDAFFSKKEASNNTSLMSIVCDKEGDVYLVGYKFAIYAEMDIKSGEITFYKGWDGYSQTTSNHISISGLRSVADKVIDIQPVFHGC